MEVQTQGCLVRGVVGHSKPPEHQHHLYCVALVLLSEKGNLFHLLLKTIHILWQSHLAGISFPTIFQCDLLETGRCHTQGNKK